MDLGVCYYPEHWPAARWADDARRMRQMGLRRVRVGEFAWSRIEPEPERFDWGWLDDAIETLHEAGLGVILGTPTATPPKWLVDAHPEMLARDAQGRVRGFGSRRHYSFSSLAYRAECGRIVEAMARRYGRHDGVVGWQTDNEYGCHSTVLSYCENAARGFRRWLKERYGRVDALNDAWGCVFWSQDYRSFDEIDLPNLTVTEPNPAHVLDFRRFASDEVISFNRLQVDSLRAHSPGRFITHNVMGHYLDFDHFALGRDLDVVTWDSYPLGFLEQFWWPEASKLTFARQGHPDCAAFHHDLYRACGRGRWGVMEQQPGPVNWAAYNPAPLPGMVRLWTLEAAAHGAELVSYFRWRQAPFAQEQMHAGLLQVDGRDAPGAREAETAWRDLETLGAFSGAETDAGESAGESGWGEAAPAQVALVFDYEAQWIFEIQPQGADFRYDELAFAFYSAARRRGLDIDIVSPNAALDGYAVVLIPSLPVVAPAFIDRARESGAQLVFGPRSGSKTAQFQVPSDLPPGALQRALGLSVNRVESLRPGLEERGEVGGRSFVVRRWKETVEASEKPAARTKTGDGVWWRAKGASYLSVWPDEALLDHVLATVLTEAGVSAPVLPDGLRLRRRGELVFAMNYGPASADLVRLAEAPRDPRAYLIGGPRLAVADVAVWRRDA